MDHLHHEMKENIISPQDINNMQLYLMDRLHITVNIQILICFTWIILHVIRCIYLAVVKYVFIVMRYQFVNDINLCTQTSTTQLLWNQ